jgi:tetratricopeptide (TPR) repeat protein
MILPMLQRLRLVGGVFAVLLVALDGNAQVQPAPRAPQVQTLPGKPPAWLKGFRFRWPVQVVGDPAKQKNTTVVVTLPTGGRLKPQATDIAVQSASGEVLPSTALSHDPAGDTVVQFQRHGNDPWYYVYGGHDAPPAAVKFDKLPQEGLTLELRDWAGDDLGSWVRVRDGLSKSDTVIGSALAAEVVQNGNPARWDRPNRFAASYRGFLDVKKDGPYRFYVNADDASFLFIDGFKVFERPGENNYRWQVKQKELTEASGKIDLKAGVHAFEVHHVVGNNARSQGVCALLWQPEDQKTFAYVPREAFVQPMLGRVAATETADGQAPGDFVHGIDDSLTSGPVKVFLVRFEAQTGNLKDADLAWDFGDGTTGTGRSVLHVYLKDGDHLVTLKAPGVPAFKRRVDVWSSPVVSSPLSLGKAVRSLAAQGWQKAGPEYARQVLAFLLACEQLERWSLLDAVAAYLINQPDLELEERVRLTTARVEALANLGKPREALKLAEEAEKQASRVPSLVLALRLSAAAVHQYHLKDPAAASKLYKAMLDDYKRVEHPNLRLAAIRWGDLYAEAGDLPKAREAYRLAGTLGGEDFAKTATVDPIARGTRLRIAEQRLKAGDVRQTRQLLEKIELDFPEQKLEGLYRFLRAEADRLGGRYESAIHDYETVARLPQWAGYRDRAVHGIADCHFRMGELEKSLEWYLTLKERYPEFYQKQKLDGAVKLIAARQERLKAARDRGDKGSVFTEGFNSGLEPGALSPASSFLLSCCPQGAWLAGWTSGTLIENEPGKPPAIGGPQNFVIARGLGVQGPHVGVLEAPAAVASFNYTRMLPDLSPDGTYWVEFWYRESHGRHNADNQQQAYGWITGEGLPDPHIPRSAPVYLERTFGQWRKLGYKIKAPQAGDGRLQLAILNFSGLMEIDGVLVRPVSDRQMDSLTSFVEGTEMP